MSTDTFSGAFFFDGDDPLYEGHFPGNPVVPGSLVVEAFVMMLQEKGFTPSEAKNFRFRTFIAPGTYAWAVTLEKGRASCTLFHRDKPAVTGEVVLG
jgi:3-hydroxyacyl-[acyl-carrier-protein] dehydratase